MDQNEKKVEEIKGQTNKISHEVTKTNKLTTENIKRVKEVEGKVTRTQEEKVCKLEEETLEKSVS